MNPFISFMPKSSHVNCANLTTVATQSFRTAERSLWENGYFENSPKIEFSSDENDFWTGGS